MPRLTLRGQEAILILRLGAVGDVIRTLPALARLRDTAPGLRLGWVVEQPSAALLPAAPWLDRVLVFPRASLEPARLLRRPVAGGRAFSRFRRELRSFGAEITLDFQGSLKSAWIGWMSGAPTRVGFDAQGAREGSHRWSTVTVTPTSPRLNRVEKNLELIDALGLPPSELRFPYATGKSTHVVREFLSPHAGKAFMAVHPGTSLLQAHKQWGGERYIDLLRRLSGEEDLLPILTWGPGEKDAAERIRAQSGGRALLAPPTNLRELRELIGSCHLFVGGDTGPMHMAWTQGVPVVALFGATDPLINGPLGEGHQILAPAWDGSRPFPPRGDASAMRLLEAREVADAISTLLVKIREGAGFSPRSGSAP